MNIYQKTSTGFIIAGVALSLAAAGVIYLSPPEKGVEEINIEQVTDKGEYKSDLLSKSINKNTIFQRGDVLIEVLEIGLKDDLLRVVINASKGGEVLKVDNPLYFKNPPIKVPDGTKHKELIERGNFIKVISF